MPRSIILSWHKARGVWRKKYNGKVHYLTKKHEHGGKSDVAGYKLALDRWQKLKAKLDGAGDDDQTSDHENHNGNGNGHARQFSTASLAIESLPVVRADYRALRRRPSLAGVSTLGESYAIADLVAAYVDKRRIEAVTGEVSVDTYREAKYKLGEFVTYCEAVGLHSIDEIDAATLEDYRNCQLALTDPTTAGDDLIAKVTAHKRLARLKQWLEYCWEQGKLDTLPRNIKKFSRITLKGEPTRLKKYGVWTLPEIRKLFNKASQRTQLYIALALNAGYTQKDLSTLEHSHIDWEEGIIKRDRHKTGADQIHKLWPVTLRLLKREITNPAKSPQFALIGQKGNSLITEKIRDDGTPSMTDSVKLAFVRLKKKTGLATDRRGFATFRKTGASLLKKHTGNNNIADLYLAHTTQATRRFYVEEDYDEYFAALDWLGNHLALGSHETKGSKETEAVA